jgi:hypothetical protein
MPNRRTELQRIIETLRRQRVRQGDFDHVVDCLLAQAGWLVEQWRSGPLADIALHVQARAMEIRRYKKSVPKFVVEELIDEFVHCLEQQAARE